VIITGKATGTETLKGMVTEVAPMAKNVVSSLGVNQKRRTVTITLRDGNGKLQPGVDIDVKIITLVKQNALKVPLSAIFDYQGQTCAFLIKNGKTKIQPVRKGIENNEEVEIQAGLKSGDCILARPDNSVKEGVRIKFPAKL
jgi:HlyD family secretion protein